MGKHTEIVGTVREILFPKADQPDAGDRYVVANVVPYKPATPRDDADGHGNGNGDGKPASPFTLTVGFTVTGFDHDGVVRKGATVRFYGQTVEHKRFGQQFQFTAAVRHLVPTRTGVVRYLSDVCHQVGQVRATALWNAYGPDAVTVLRTDPARVIADGHLTPEVAELASTTLIGLSRNEAARIELCELFQGRGFPRSAIADAVRLWGIRAAEMVRRNPFNLMTAGVSGCGFVRCDRLYLDLGKNPRSLKRQALAAWHAIREGGTGDTWHNVADVVRGIVKRVGSSESQVRKALACGLRTAAWARATIPGVRNSRPTTSLFSRRVDNLGHEWIALGEEADQERGVAASVKRLLVRTGGPTP